MKKNKKLFKKKAPQFKIGLFLSYFLIAFNLLYGFFFFPYVIGIIGDAQYGIYKAVASLAAQLTLIDFGVTAAITRFIGKFVAENNKEGEERYLGMAMTQSMIVICIIFVGAIVMIFLINPIFSSTFSDSQMVNAYIIFAFLFLDTIISVPLSFLLAISIGHSKFIFSNGLKILQMITKVAISLLLVSLFKGAIFLVFSSIIVSICCLVISAFFVINKLKIKVRLEKNMFKNPFFKESAIYISIMLIGSVINLFNGNIDLILIGSQISPVAVTVYSYALLFYSAYNSLGLSISNMMLPKISIDLFSPNSDMAVEETIIKVGRFQAFLLGAGLTGYILFGERFINLWLGDGYSDVWILGLILLFGAFFPMIQTVCHTVLKAKNKLIFRTIVMLIGCSFNFTVMYLGLKTGNLIWAAIGTTSSSFIFEVIVMNFYYKKIIGLNIWHILKKILIGPLLCCLFASFFSYIFININESSISNYILSICLFLFLFFVAIILFGFNLQERRYFFGLGKNKLILDFDFNFSGNKPLYIPYSDKEELDFLLTQLKMKKVENPANDFSNSYSFDEMEKMKDVAKQNFLIRWDVISENENMQYERFPLFKKKLSYSVFSNILFRPIHLIKKMLFLRSYIAKGQDSKIKKIKQESTLFSLSFIFVILLPLALFFDVNPYVKADMLRKMVVNEEVTSCNVVIQDSNYPLSNFKDDYVDFNLLNNKFFSSNNIFFFEGITNEARSYYSLENKNQLSFQDFSLIYYSELFAFPEESTNEMIINHFKNSNVDLLSVDRTIVKDEHAIIIDLQTAITLFGEDDNVGNYLGKTITSRYLYTYSGDYFYRESKISGVISNSRDIYKPTDGSLVFSNKKTINLPIAGMRFMALLGENSYANSMGLIKISQLSNFNDLNVTYKLFLNDIRRSDLEIIFYKNYGAVDLNGNSWFDPLLLFVIYFIIVFIIVYIVSARYYKRLFTIFTYSYFTIVSFIALLSFLAFSVFSFIGMINTSFVITLSLFSLCFSLSALIIIIGKFAYFYNNKNNSVTKK